MAKHLLFLITSLLLATCANKNDDGIPLIRDHVLAAWDSGFAIQRGTGAVLAWGDNSHGQLADGTVNASNKPVVVSGLSGVTGLCAGQSFAAAMKPDGTVYVWGRGDNAQLAATATSESHFVNQVGGIERIQSIRCGMAHVLALKDDGTIWSWGLNSHGQLGDGTAGKNHATPTQVKALTGVLAIAAGKRFSVALRGDGTVWTWGEDTKSELGDAGAAGTLRAIPDQVAGIADIASISAFGEYVIAMDRYGNVYTWGDNSTGNLGDGTTVDRGVPTKLLSIQNITQVSAGTASFAVQKTGGVFAWGDNTNGALGLQTTQNFVTTPINSGGVYDTTEITPGLGFTIFRAINGSVRAMGLNTNGQLGIGSSSVTPVFVPTLLPDAGT